MPTEAKDTTASSGDLPDERESETRKLPAGGYIIAGKYPDGRLGEVFIVVDRAGSLERGYADAAGIAASILLQAGAPLWEAFGPLLYGRDGTGYAGSVAATVLDQAARWVLERFSDARTRVRKFRIGVDQVSGIILAGVDDAGRLVSVDVVADGADPTVRDATERVSSLASALLRRGVPLVDVARRYVRARFGPAGMTGDADIPTASSVLDYAFRRLLLDYAPDDYGELCLAGQAAGGAG